MGRIVVSEFVSLDGAIEEPAWTFQFERGPTGDKFKLEELFAANALLLGRVTYQGFAAAWPEITDEEGFAERMNSLPKYVVSATLGDAEATWNNTTVIRGDVVSEIAALRTHDGGDLLVYGSGQLVHTLVQHDLVDVYRLMVFPIVLGAGRRFFPDSLGESANLELTDSSTAGAGIVMLTYRRAADKA